MRGSERAFIATGLCSDPGDVVWPFSTQSHLLLLQHTCFRGSFGDAIRDVSGFNKWEVPPCHPREGESCVAPGGMTDAVAYQGCEWQLASLCPTFTEGSPNRAAIQDSLPNSSDSGHTKEVPWGGSQVPKEGRFIFKPLCCLHLQTDGPPLSQIEAVESHLLLTFFTHLISWIRAALEHPLKCSQTQWQSFGLVLPLERRILNRV